MNYQLVSQDIEGVRFYSARNLNNDYAYFLGGGEEYLAYWPTQSELHEYMQHSASRLVWKPHPRDEGTRTKKVSSVVSAGYKPANVDTLTRPVRMSGCCLYATYDPAEHMRQRWAEQRARMAEQQPLVWPVIPPHDDGSNEEASTVSEALVQAMAQRFFVVRIVNALRRY